MDRKEFIKTQKARYTKKVMVDEANRGVWLTTGKYNTKTLSPIFSSQKNFRGLEQARQYAVKLAKKNNTKIYSRHTGKTYTPDDFKKWNTTERDYSGRTKTSSDKDSIWKKILR